MRTRTGETVEMYRKRTPPRLPFGTNVPSNVFRSEKMVGELGRKVSMQATETERLNSGGKAFDHLPCCSITRGTRGAPLIKPPRYTVAEVCSPSGLRKWNSTCRRMCAMSPWGQGCRPQLSNWHFLSLVQRALAAASVAMLIRGEERRCVALRA